MPDIVEITQESLQVIAQNSVIELKNASPIIEIIQNNPVIEELRPSPIEIIEVVQQGLPGEDGEDGGFITVTAGENISAKRAVYIDADTQKALLASNTDPLHPRIIAGITNTSVTSNNSVDVVYQGVVTNNTWNWDLDNPEIYLGTAGNLTQTPPSSGFHIEIGYAISSTKMFIRIAQPINLN